MWKESKGACCVGADYRYWCTAGMEVGGEVLLCVEGEKGCLLCWCNSPCLTVYLILLCCVLLCCNASWRRWTERTTASQS